VKWLRFKRSATVFGRSGVSLIVDLNGLRIRVLIPHGLLQGSVLDVRPTGKRQSGHGSALWRRTAVMQTPMLMGNEPVGKNDLESITQPAAGSEARR